MGNIYSLSLFTIAASCAANGLSSFFSAQNLLGFRGFDFQLGDGVEQEGAEGGGRLWIHGCDSRHDINWLSTGTSNTLKTASLEAFYHRGGAVQERCLSSRTIFFGTHVLFLRYRLRFFGIINYGLWCHHLQLEEELP